MTMIKKHLILILICCFCGTLFAQETGKKKKKEKLDTEEITVTKSFSPTVKDAFKIKSSPKIDSVAIYDKKQVDYHIESIPVASTFSPAKGKPKALQRGPKERFYQNFISAGYGNYGTPIVEIFAHTNTSNYNDFGGYFNLHSSKGGIEGVQLDDDFLNIHTDLFYKQTERYFDWQAHAGISHLVNNWYGLSNEIKFTKPVLASIEEKQSYSELYANGEIEFFDALIHKGNAELSRFVDKQNSAENYGLINGTVDFPIANEMIYTDISLEFLSGKFAHNFDLNDDIKYTFFNIGVSPNFEILRENLTVNLGARLYYGITNTNDGSQFYIYPNITASYNISDETLIAFAGVTGDLEQNSYRNFVKENPFVSPTLDIRRTSQQYYGYAGLKGLLNSNINFNVKVAYGNEDNKALFKLNPSKTDGNTILLDQGYAAGNSFQVVYDNVSTLQASAELIVDFTEEFKFGGNIEYNIYNLDQEAYAWNLPDLKATLIANYSRPKWRAGADLFFVTERKDEFTIIPIGVTQSVTNDAYFDVNLNGIYHINDKFSAFLNVNNILGQNYQQYTYFKVQGFQVFAGFKFRFDL